MDNQYNMDAGGTIKESMEDRVRTYMTTYTIYTTTTTIIATILALRFAFRLANMLIENHLVRKLALARRYGNVDVMDSDTIETLIKLLSTLLYEFREAIALTLITTGFMTLLIIYGIVTVLRATRNPMHKAISYIIVILGIFMVISLIYSGAITHQSTLNDIYNKLSMNRDKIIDGIIHGRAPLINNHSQIYQVILYSLFYLLQSHLLYTITSSMCEKLRGPSKWFSIGIALTGVNQLLAIFRNIPLISLVSLTIIIASIIWYESNYRAYRARLSYEQLS